jgi:hypothetical protein
MQSGLNSEVKEIALMVQFPVDTVQRTSRVMQGQGTAVRKVDSNKARQNGKKSKWRGKRKEDERWKNLGKRCQKEIKRKTRQTVRKERNQTKIIKTKRRNQKGTKQRWKC